MGFRRGGVKLTPPPAYPRFQVPQQGWGYLTLLIRLRFQGYPCASDKLSVDGGALLLNDISAEATKTQEARNQDCEKIVCINSVNLSPKSHPL